jgi:hypothetical protein
MCSTGVPIIFIHLGDAPPAYLASAVKQARLWNPNAPIVCISSVIQDYSCGEEWVSVNTIPMGESHTRFLETTRLPGEKYDKGFWKWTTERLFVLNDWMTWKGVRECFHLENDNMLYQNIEDIIPLLRAVSPGLSTTFQGQGSQRNSLRACFSVMYCCSVDALSNFLFYLAATPSIMAEMERGGLYWLDTPEECSYLPTAPVGVVLDSERYRSWFEDERFKELGIIFDSAMYGQILGGIDTRGEIPSETQGKGYVNPDSEMRADQYEYVWRKDELGRRYPTIKDTGGKVWKIANLHIHCKRLADFSSYNHNLC